MNRYPENNELSLCSKKGPEAKGVFNLLPKSIQHTISAMILATATTGMSCAPDEMDHNDQTSVQAIAKVSDKVEEKKLGYGGISFNADFVAFQGGYDMSPIIIQAYLDGTFAGESDVIAPGRFKFEVPYTAKNKRIVFKAFQATENGDLGQEIEFTRDHKTANPNAIVAISSSMNFGW